MIPPDVIIPLSCVFLLFSGSFTSPDSVWHPGRWFTLSFCGNFPGHLIPPRRSPDLFLCGHVFFDFFFVILPESGHFPSPRYGQYIVYFRGAIIPPFLLSSTLYALSFSWLFFFSERMLLMLSEGWGDFLNCFLLPLSSLDFGFLRWRRGFSYEIQASLCFMNRSEYCAPSDRSFRASSFRSTTPFCSFHLRVFSIFLHPRVSRSSPPTIPAFFCLRVQLITGAPLLLYSFSDVVGGWWHGS